MSVPTTQKALWLTRRAGPYEVADIDVPVPDAGEVLVRVEATALNPSEWKARFTAYSAFIKKYPVIQGSDASGVVVALGAGVAKFKLGDRVLHQGFLTNKLATFQQYTCPPANLVANIPEGLTFDQAATVPLALMTGAVGLYQRRNPVSGGAGLDPFWREGGRGKYAGRPILVFGGASAVGQYAIQFAKLSGFSPIITTVSPSHFDLVESLGATHPLDRSLSYPALAEALKEITSKPVDIIYDAISTEETQETAFNVLSSNGVLVIVLNEAISAENRSASPDKEVIETYGLPHLDPNQELGAEVYEHITEWFQAGELKTTGTEYVPGGLAAIPEAQDRLRAGLVGPRKLVVHPPETV